MYEENGGGLGYAYDFDGMVDRGAPVLVPNGEYVMVVDEASVVVGGNGRKPALQLFLVFRDGRDGYVVDRVFFKCSGALASSAVPRGAWDVGVVRVGAVFGAGGS